MITVYIKGHETRRVDLQACWQVKLGGYSNSPIRNNEGLV